MKIKTQEDTVLTLPQLNDFIEKNSESIYTYINDEVLQGIGVMHSDYFSKIIQETFPKTLNTKLSIDSLNPNILPYFIFTVISGNGKLDYTSLRVDTINFDNIDKEALVYYNYVQFSLKDNFLSIELMQTKIGGMPIDKDIVKFTKRVPIKSSGLQDFILK